MASSETHCRNAKLRICRRKSHGLRSAGQLLLLACLVALTLSGSRAGDADVRILNGFNDEAECARFRMGAKVELVEEHVTEGKKAAKITFPAGKEYAGFGVGINDAGIGREVLANWGNYDYFAFDVFNPNEGNSDIDIRIDDDKSTNDWSTWSDNMFRAVPGINHFRLKTSRITNNVQPWLKRNLDPNRLTRFGLWLSPTSKTDTVLYFDNFSLRKNPKVELPKAMCAFQFGSTDSDCWPGFTAVTPKSQYSDKTGYGFSDTANLAGLDDLFDREGLKNGDPLCGSGVYRPGGPLTFTVRLAAGRYRLWCAAGMTIYPKRRYTVSCNGQRIFECSPGDRLKDLDPFGRDYTTKSTVWELLAAGQLCDECTAEVDVTGGKAEITLEGNYASYLTGGLRTLVLYPVGDAEAEKALADIQRQRRGKFLERWRELKPAKLPAAPEFTAEEQARGFMLACRHYCEDITPYFVPKGEDRLAKLSIAATPGEKEPAVFIVCPIKDAQKCEVQVGESTGPAGAIPASAVTIEYVHYRYTKGNGGIDVVPSHIVPRNYLAVEKGVPRQFWMTVTVPESASPGKYAGTVTVSAGDGKASFPLEIEVYPFKLDSVADCGLIYAHVFSVPSAMEDFEAGIRRLAEHNCNSATLGNVISVNRQLYKDTGKVAANFDRLDMAMEIMKKAGMTGPVPLFDMSIQGEGGGNSYSHIGLGKGRELEEQRYFDAMTELTRQIDQHAREKNYLPVLMYPVTELSNDPQMGPPYLKKLIAAFRKAGDVKLVCSLNAPRDIVCAGDLDHMMVNWGLNLTEERLARIRNDGAKLWFQNIGKSRYTEGFLMLKAGAIGRRQFTVSCDGAGSDAQGGDPYNCFCGGGNGSMFRTVDGAIPNVTLKRMSEGADDCRYAYKLLALIKEANEKGSDRAKAAAATAKKTYDDILAAIRIDTGGAKIEIDGRCDSIADSTDVFDRFRRTIAGHIVTMAKALGEK
ncbi:MAG: hypothetical protein NTW87_11255 [Planctomycetota bacterium]|nr:hypothetical protein [Planctomycetota bacterium]